MRGCSGCSESQQASERARARERARERQSRETSTAEGGTTTKVAQQCPRLADECTTCTTLKWPLEIRNLRRMAASRYFWSSHMSSRGRHAQRQRPYRLIHLAFLMSTFCSSLQARFRFARYVNPSYKKLVIKSIFCTVCVRVMVFVHSVPACPSGTAPSRLPTCTPATAPVGALLGRKCEGPSNSTAHVRVLLLLSPPILRPLSCTIMLMEYPDFGQRTSTRYAYLHRQPLYVHA